MSGFFSEYQGAERVTQILNVIQTLATNFETVSTNKQQMYAQGMELWAQDLQEAIQQLGEGTSNGKTQG